MYQRQSKSQPRWTDVKAKLTSFDRPALLSLIQDLYSAHKDNQTFLHTRFGLGEDMLRPYKETIDRWLWPDAFSRQVPSVLKAKQAISNSEQVTLSHPVMPVADGFRGGFVGMDGGELR